MSGILPWLNITALEPLRSRLKTTIGGVAAEFEKPAGPAAMRGSLSVEGVCKRFGDVQVLEDIRFDVAGGQFVTLLGPSGCGKTTLLRIIAGLELADRGRVLLGGQDLGDLPANRRPVNTVFQSYALFPHLSVYENVAFGLRARRFARMDIHRRVSQALDMLQLDEFARRYPDQLSGGQKQRVALARALVNEPEVLLLDEPMSALDAKLRAEVQVELRRLQQRLGKTFILVTHDQDEAMTVSDRIIVMKQGTIEQSGSPAEVYERPASRFVAEFLGAANLIAAQRIEAGVRTVVGDLEVKDRPAWEQGTLAIRPEHIRLATQQPAHNAFRGTVKEVIYRGSYKEILVDPGNLRVRVSPAAPVREGKAVWLEILKEYLEVLRD